MNLEIECDDDAKKFNFGFSVATFAQFEKISKDVWKKNVF